MGVPQRVSDDLLPILVVTSDNYRDVFSYWENSLDALRYPTSKRHVVSLGQLDPPFGYCTASWCLAIERQLSEVVKWIETHQSQMFLHTDGDIQFFPKFLEAQREWLELMREERLDMLFMRERTKFMPEQREGEVNAGFVIIHCNNRTLQFWRQVLENQLRDPKMSGYPPYTDQYHINRLLTYRRGGGPQDGDFGIRWDMIPEHDCIWSEPANDNELVKAAFHHAVNTHDKPALLEAVRSAVRSRQGSGAPPEHQVCKSDRQLGAEIDRLAECLRLARIDLEALSSADADQARQEMAPACEQLLKEVEALAAVVASPTTVKRSDEPPQRASPCQGASEKITFDLVD